MNIKSKIYKIARIITYSILACGLYTISYEIMVIPDGGYIRKLSVIFMIVTIVTIITAFVYVCMRPEDEYNAIIKKNKDNKEPKPDLDS